MKICPNCGELVGDRAEVCFNCKHNFIYKRVVKEGDDLTVQDFVEELAYKHNWTVSAFIGKGKYDEAVSFIQNYFQCDIEIATDILVLFKDQIYDKNQIMLKEAAARARARGVGTPSNYVPNEPKCPTCGSTLVKRLSVVNRGASVAVLGVYSNKFNKSFECKNCGYTW